MLRSCGMATFACLVSTSLLIYVSVARAVSPNSSRCEYCNQTILRRELFPLNFVFGAASAAYQFEGAVDVNGKGPSTWDNFTHTYPAKIKDHSNGDIAVDSYHRYKEDVKIAKDMGLDAYRFSISWSRILPGGTMKAGVNQDGIDYYNNLINELHANGMEPFVTILHFDIPQALEDAYGGFLSTRIVDDVQDFSELLFSEFGDRVKNWITINEAWTASVYGYAYGYFAPGRCSKWQGNNCTCGDSATEPYVVMHNLILAHSAIVNLYRYKHQESQEGKIGMSLASFWFEPYDEKDENQKARDRAFDFMLGWIMEPLTIGKYPESMKIRVGHRLPKFTKNQKNLISGSFDFIGFNYYGAIYALANKQHSSALSYLTDSAVEITGIRNGIPIGEQARNTSHIFIYPQGLRKVLRYIEQRYNNPIIYITENGIDETPNDDLPIAQVLKDDLRRDYIHDHLCCLLEGIKEDGSNVKGYFAWSLMDNFEWAYGFTVRFGLYYVDYKNKLKRYPKHSAIWFKQFLMTRYPNIMGHWYQTNGNPI